MLRSKKDVDRHVRDILNKIKNEDEVSDEYRCWRTLGRVLRLLQGFARGFFGFWEIVLGAGVSGDGGFLLGEGVL